LRNHDAERNSFLDDARMSWSLVRRDLKAAGREKVFAEQVSSVVARAKLTTALEFVREGDVPVVTKPDRLACSTRNLLDIVEDLEKRGIALVVLLMDGQRINTRGPTEKLMLTMLGAIATFERDLMLERQREGIAKAAAEDKYRGRAPTAAPRRPTCFDWQRRARHATRSRPTWELAPPPCTASWQRHGRQVRARRRPARLI
jgi:DNA invertase Pin-like site-specific DNA recombinase